MGDTSGGKKYEEMKEFVYNGNLTMVANTDGVQLFQSSSVSMWPEVQNVLFCLQQSGQLQRPRDHYCACTHKVITI